MIFLPSAAITLFAVAANLLADGFHDALDPRRWSQRRVPRERRSLRRLVPAPRRG
jgi:hypothetical protein